MDSFLLRILLLLVNFQHTDSVIFSWNRDIVFSDTSRWVITLIFTS
jgi:hypothetical protein